MRMQTFTFKVRNLFVLVMLLCGVSSRAAEDLITQQITINVAEAGTLSGKIGTNKMYKITNLKLTGFLNGLDIAFIRNISGDGCHLEILDMSEAQIVYGGRYKTYCTCSANEIGNGMFQDCKSLKTIIVPSSVKRIWFDAFRDCTNLTTFVIPDGITSIDMGTFMECTNLEKVSIPNSVVEIGMDAFQGCTSLKSLDIPNSVTKIEMSAFKKCESLESIKLPKDLKVISEYVFWGCKKISAIQIPQSVTDIGILAFGDCLELSSFIIPQNVKSLGDGCFRNCSKLQSIYVYSDNVLNVGDNAFKGCDKEKCMVYIPKGTYNDYWLTEFSYFDNLIEFDATSVNSIPTSLSAKQLSRYSVNGQRLAFPVKGLNIVKYSDGSVRKEILK